ncbi:MAG TPA: ATP-binding protein, partial [Kofleriaceae bacterium]|nr:ATP-binding protein [Kofleriaceae bacterium]
ELMRELGLDDRAIDVMLVIASASLRGEIARLYGILANDAGRPLVDDTLVHQVLASRHDRHDLADELDPRAPLVRLGVVQVSTRRARPFAELTIDPVIADRLRAIPVGLGTATAVHVSTRAVATLDLSREVLEAATCTLARPATEPVRIAVTGRTGSGRRTLVAALAAAAGRDLAVVDATLLARGADAFVVELRRALRRSHLAGLLPCIVRLGDVTFDDRAGSHLAAEPIRNHPGPVAVIGMPEATMPFEAGHVSIALGVLPETERRRVWERALVEVGKARDDVDALAARYKIGPGVIRHAVAHASPEAYIRQTRDARLAQYARRVDRLATWSSVVLPPDILDSLRELVARVRHGRTVFEAWGMNRTMATSRGLTALFGGQPGTGKTLVAGVIARELGLDLYQVDLSKVISKWIGETERNLSAIFDAAEDGQAILLFDEADSLFAKRTEVRSSNDRYANLEVNYLLQRLDAFEGIAILTTNASGSIDPAFKRRLSFRLSFPFPDDETREQLWRAHLPPELPVVGPLALDVLARKYQLSGGYIRNACLRAAFLAAQDETALHQRHLERAVALEFAELGKLSSGGAVD